MVKNRGRGPSFNAQSWGRMVKGETEVGNRSPREAGMGECG